MYEVVLTRVSDQSCLHVIVFYNQFHIKFRWPNLIDTTAIEIRRLTSDICDWAAMAAALASVDSLVLVNTTRFGVINRGIHTSVLLSQCHQDSHGANIGISKGSHASSVGNKANHKHYNENIDMVAISGTTYENVSPLVNNSMVQHGYCVLKNAIQHESLQAAKKSLQSIIRNLQQRYDHFADEFEGSFLCLLIFICVLIV